MNTRSGPIRFLAVCAASAVVIFQIFALAGCGMPDGSRSSTAPTSGSAQGRSLLRRSVGLTVWSSEEDQPMLRQQCDAFCASYSGADVNITLLAVDPDTAAQKAMRDPDGAADVYAVRGSALGGLARSGAVAENTLTKDSVTGRFSADDLAPSIIDGRLYGYPCYRDGCILYYDRSKLGSGDVSSLEGICGKVRDMNNGAGKGSRTVCPFAADFTDTGFASSVFLTASLGGSGNIASRAAEETDFSSDESMEAARYIASLDGLGVEDMDRKTAAARFGAGTLASYAAGTECAGEIKRALGDNYAAAAMPSINIGGRDRQLACFSDSVVYVVKSATSHPEEAAALADYLTGDERMLDRLGKRGLLPASSRLAGHPSVKDGSAAAALRTQLDRSVISPAADLMEDIWRPVAELGRELFGGKVGDRDIRGRLEGLPGYRRNDK